MPLPDTPPKVMPEKYRKGKGAAKGGNSENSSEIADMKAQMGSLMAMLSDMKSKKCGIAMAERVPAATVLAARKADGTVKERTVVCGELDELRDMLAEFAKEVHDFCEMSHKSCAIASRTVIDSGSGGTFNSITNVTDATNVVKVTGFDGSSTLTKGNGSTTMVVVDESGATRAIHRA